MAKLSYSAALQQLEQGQVSGSYLLLGDNYYQSFFLTELILRNRIPAGQRAYNKYEIAGQKANPQALEEPLYAVPLLGGNKVVVVTDLQRVPAKGQEFLVKALAKLDPSITFVGSARKLDGRKSFSKNLTKQCSVVELKELNNRVLPGYVKSRFAARGISVDEKGVIEFCRVVGRDCGEIEREVDKALDRFGKGSSLRFDEVKDLLSASRHFSRYEVATYIAGKQLERALAALEEVLATGGTEARGLLWATYQHLERMLVYKSQSGAMSRDDLAGRLRMHPFFLKELAQQCTKWGDTEVVRGLLQIYQAEVDERFTGENRRQIWERALIGMLAQRGE